MKDLKLGVNDLPEITVINREIERFKKTMLRNPRHDEEENLRAVVERHFLNGLERAREVLLLNYYQSLQRFGSVAKEEKTSNPEMEGSALHEKDSCP